MLESITNIEEFLVNVKEYSAFASNKVLCHAVVYNLQCIGESVYMLSLDFKRKHPEMDWDAIAGMRHVLVHDYYQVNMETVWKIVEKDLLPLKSYVEKQL